VSSPERALPPTLLVLAAGMGSRFGGLKQCEPVGPRGETLLDYAVFDALRAGFRRVVFVVRDSFARRFEDEIAARYRDRLRVDLVCQQLDDLPDHRSAPAGRTKPWGTTQAVLAARALIDEPFAVINADDFYGSEAYQQVARFFADVQARSQPPEIYCMVGYELALTLSPSGGVNRGLCVAEGDLLASVQEVRDIVADDVGRCAGLDLKGVRVPIAADALVSMNFWGFMPTVFEPMARHFADFLSVHGDDATAECYIPSVVDALIRARVADCRILRTRDSWFGITYPQDKADCVQRLRRLTKNGSYPTALWA
jgi:CTP:molybdopterin cytidylyltransferase MocA